MATSDWRLATGARAVLLALGLVLGLAAAQSGPLPGQLDINHAKREQVLSLPVDSAVAEGIWEYMTEYGRLSSIYDLMSVPGMTSPLLEKLKPAVYVSLREDDERRQRKVHLVQRRLASEEGPTAAAVEQWQDLLLTPMNVNRATIDDLYGLDNVSLVDAVAVVKHLRSGQEIAEYRDLAYRVVGLSNYGYRNIRDYVTYSDLKWTGFGGNYRVSYETDPNWELSFTTGEFGQALSVMTEDSAAFREAGFTEDELARIRGRLQAEQSFAGQTRNAASVRNRLRLRYGDYLRFGGWLDEKLYEPGFANVVKAFGSVQSIGPLRRVFFGDYRVTFGQGLLLDNTADLMVRTYDRAQGLYSDLSENAGASFRGGAAELVASRVGAVGFFSKTRRDAILNPDSTVNYYIITTPRYPTFKDVLGETDAGGSLRFDLGGFGFIPVGTRLALNALSVGYDRSFMPMAKYLDLPGDAEVLNDPNYTRLSTGRKRLFYGADFRTVVENVSLEGELAVQPKLDSSALPDKNAAFAGLVKARAQYDYLYVTALFRHYDIGYDNPYNRGYCEQLRFEDTPLEKSYRVIDPAYSHLQDYPMPKAERGFLLDTRYQVSRQVTFTRAYIDVWRNLAWGVDNIRFQGEVEWRPVFPVRLRFKQKLQSKGLPKPVLGTRSFTSETSIRTMASLTDWDFLTGEIREGRVYLTPTMEYGDNASMSGNFLSVQWDHNFSDDFNAEVGVAAWLTRSMSQWIFEDSGIDFLEGDGMKWYAALSDRISDRLLVYVKYRQKVSDFPHTGLGNAEGLHFPGSNEAVRDFVTRNEDFGISLQVDLFW